ncbi:hypothetical protein SLEP1_g1156 [Rubroshorea leprosula]|uniref:Uncharacterized protein n=1 Tax=Rubroshorea leprosula TaxID=152421 RepID=A0AAV5HLA2_9ROSI|nr:hypothetical protein SLEP1_g1156 [Rubroshorea leprosula]
MCCFPTKQWGSSPPSPKNREEEVVPVEFDYTSQFQQKASPRKNGKLRQVHQPQMTEQGNGQPEELPSHILVPENPKAAEQTTAQNIENQFTDYINRSKDKIKKMSSMGEGSSSGGANNQGGKESKDNQFSEYIKRAGKKIRTTSGIKDRME